MSGFAFFRVLGIGGLAVLAFGPGTPLQAQSPHVGDEETSAIEGWNGGARTGVLPSVPSALPIPVQRGRSTAGPAKKRKSPRTAILFSLLGTAVPVGAGAVYIRTDDEPDAPGGAIAAVGVGAIIGPSLGHFYAQDQQAWAGLGIRALSAGVGVAGFAVSLRRALGGRDPGVAQWVLYGSMVVLGASGLYDIATASRSARQYNERNDVRIQITPRVHFRFGQVGLSVSLHL